MDKEKGATSHMHVERNGKFTAKVSNIAEARGGQEKAIGGFKTGGRTDPTDRLPDTLQAMKSGVSGITPPADDGFDRADGAKPRNGKQRKMATPITVIQTPRTTAGQTGLTPKEQADWAYGPVKADSKH